MRFNNLVFSGLLIVATVFGVSAHAQLAGTDTVPGSSCASFPTGATRITADADSDGNQVTLVCDGTNWVQEGIVVLSKAGASPTPDSSSLWSSGTGDKIYYNTGTPEVGIGTTSPTVALDVVGDIHYTGVLQDVSDRRMKTAIQPLNGAMEKIRRLEGVSFVMKDDPKGRVELGLIAQNVETAYPKLVGHASGGALLHKSADGRSFPFPGRTHPTVSVIGMPSAVKPFKTATRTWNSAT